MGILDKIENKRIKGFLTARHKIIYPDAIYHLTQRAPGKEKLFLEDDDYLYMLSLIKETAHKYGWKIFSFALMPNHLHLLLQIKECNLSEGAKKIFERYAKYFNVKYKRKGPVFCKPYRVSLCLDESYLLAISLYIHLNPFKGGIVDKPLDYRWSSIRLFTDEGSPASFVEYKFVLSILNEDLNKARNIYKDLLQESRNFEYENVLESPNFMRKFKIMVSDIAYPFKKRDKKNSKSWTLDKEIMEFCHKRRLREPQHLEARKYLIEQLLSDGFRVVEIASLLGMSRQSVYNTLSFKK